MTEQFTRVEINCETGEETIVPLTEKEVADLLKFRENAAAAAEAAAAEAETKAAAKASALAKLTALGLTEAEAAAIAGA